MRISDWSSDVCSSDLSVVVENRPGAGGNIGTRDAINSKPDGYTILINSIGPIAINPSLYTKLGHNPQTDLIPLTLVADVPNVLVVSPSLNIKSVQELIAAIKKEPEKYNCASTGVGTAAHLSCELLSRSTKPIGRASCRERVGQYV